MFVVKFTRMCSKRRDVVFSGSESGLSTKTTLIFTPFRECCSKEDNGKAFSVLKKLPGRMLRGWLGILVKECKKCKRKGSIMFI